MQGKYTPVSLRQQCCLLPPSARPDSGLGTTDAARPEDRHACSRSEHQEQQVQVAETRPGTLGTASGRPLCADMQAGPTGGANGAHGHMATAPCSCPTAPKDDAPARLPEAGDDEAASQRHNASRSSCHFCGSRQKAPPSEKRHLWVFLCPSLTRSQPDKFSATPSQLLRVEATA